MRVSIGGESDGDRRLLDAVLEKLTELSRDVKSVKMDGEEFRRDLKSLSHDVKSLKMDGEEFRRDLKSLKADSESSKRQLSSIDRQLGLVWEAEGRKNAEALFGSQCAKGLVARSIQDLSYCLPADVINRGEYRGQCHRVPLELTTRVIKRLIDGSVPERLLRCIATKLEVCTL